MGVGTGAWVGCGLEAGIGVGFVIVGVGRAGGMVACWVGAAAVGCVWTSEVEVVAVGVRARVWPA